MKPCWVIDAYNVIHKITKLRSGVVSNLEGTRNAFLGSVRSFLSNRSATGIVVFDGAGAGGRTPRSSASFQIVFTIPPRTADDEIKHIIDQRKNRTALVVVSSDMEVYRYAKASGCKVITSEEFGNCLRLPKETGSNQKDNPQLSPSEIKHWLDLFQ